MTIKKTLIITSKQDVTPFTDEYIEGFVAKMKRSAKLCDATIECEVVKEEQEEAPVDLIDQWLKAASEAGKDGADYPVLRIESNGTILKFDANDVVKDDDEAPRD